MCGEHHLVNACAEHGKGSSPHVRGAHRRGYATGCPAGIIPACAGSTYFGRWRGTALRDHPRMCGEHLIVVHRFVSLMGSSPHVRGARAASDSSRCPSGIIPACAGSTHCPPTHLVSARDHPRMCGEHWPNTTPYLLDKGSSPHVRGAPSTTIIGSLRPGIIPACAGSTKYPIICQVGRRDHPRMCGEHNDTKVTAEGLPGSSPHVRGALIFECAT